jgi:hypothetical protein
MPTVPTFKRSQRATIRCWQESHPELDIHFHATSDQGPCLEVPVPEMQGLAWKGHESWIIIPESSGEVAVNVVGDRWEYYPTLRSALHGVASACSLMQMIAKSTNSHVTA